MTYTESGLSELLAAVQAGEMTEKIRTSVAWVLQQLIEAELTDTIGAGPHERTETRTAQRNGHRPKLINTAAGDVELYIVRTYDSPVASVFRAWAGGRPHRSNAA